MLCISYKTKSNDLKKPVKFSYRNYNKIDKEKLFSEASVLDWSKFFNEQDINTKVQLFNENYEKLFNNNVPLTKVNLKCNSNPWFI